MQVILISGIVEGEVKEFDILTYSSNYCEVDCHVLRLGYEILQVGCLSIQA